MINLKKIKELVEFYYGLEDISIRKRTQDYVDARTIYVVLSRELTEYSYAVISSHINRDHSSITHAINVIYNQWRSQKYRFRRQLQIIDTIYEILADKKEEAEQEIPSEAVIQSLKSKLILKDKEIKELYRLLEAKDEKIKELNKYKPVW